MFGTSFDTSSDKFQNYYKDLSLRLKNREIDLVIVVNMFLTGFDATTLNTLWVDKNLRAHGLIQAYSRTNRILNSVKTYGNIVSFRDLEEETNDAIALFGNKDARGIVLLKPYAEYYDEYAEQGHRAARRVPARPADRRRDSAEGVHRAVRRDPAAAEHPDVVRRLRRQRDPHATGRGRTTGASTWTCTPSSAHGRDAEKESINDDVVFEIELIKQVEINVDYILMLVEKYRDAKGDGDDKEIRAAIERAVDSSPSLRNKKDLIEDFVESLSATSEVDDEWPAFIAAKRAEELDRIITEEGLDRERRAPSSRRRSATAPSNRPAPRSPRSCRQCPASRRPAVTRRRSRPCSRSSATSSNASSASADVGCSHRLVDPVALQ